MNKKCRIGNGRKRNSIFEQNFDYVIDFVQFYVFTVIIGMLSVKRLKSVHCHSGSCTVNIK